VHRNNLLVNINSYNPFYNERFNGYVQAFIAKGKSISDATRMAYGAIEGAVQKQSTLLSYNDAYWIVGIVMLCAIPMVYLAPFVKGQKAVSDSH